MIIDPTIQAAIDDGTLSADQVAQSAWDALEKTLREGFEPWARARGDADEAKVARVKILLERLLREGRAEMSRPRSTNVH